MNFIRILYKGYPKIHARFEFCIICAVLLPMKKKKKDSMTSEFWKFKIIKNGTLHEKTSIFIIEQYFIKIMIFEQNHLQRFEVYFHFNELLILQNYHIWSSENPRIMRNKCIHNVSLFGTDFGNIILLRKCS